MWAAIKGGLSFFLSISGVGKALADWLKSRQDNANGRRDERDESLQKTNAIQKKQADIASAPPVSDSDILERMQRGDL